jgi:hypothetical protein
MAIVYTSCAYKVSEGFPSVNFFVFSSGTTHPLIVYTMLLELASWALALSCLSSVNAHINHTTVTRYLFQCDPKSNASMFDFTATNFGLINRTYPSDSNCASSANKTQWQRFADQVAAPNAAMPPNAEYKVFYMGRHGEGYHNAAESYYGTPG